MKTGEDAGMRLDSFLARARIVAPRADAKRACDNGIVSVNDRVAKASASVAIGDRISVAFVDQELVVEVTKYPGKSLPKALASSHYALIRDSRAALGGEGS